MVGLLATVGFFATWILGSIYSGWILKTLWTWFVVPTFGLPGLSIASAIGLGLVVRWLTYVYHSESEEERSKGFGEKWLTAVMTGGIIGLLCLLVGWICKQYM